MVRVGIRDTNRCIVVEREHSPVLHRRASTIEPAPLHRCRLDTGHESKLDF